MHPGKLALKLAEWNDDLHTHPVGLRRWRYLSANTNTASSWKQDYKTMDCSGSAKEICFVREQQLQKYAGALNLRGKHILKAYWRSFLPVWIGMFARESKSCIRNNSQATAFRFQPGVVKKTISFGEGSERRNKGQAYSQADCNDKKLQ